MVATIPYNPNATTVAAGSFNAQSQGYVQGTAQNDPSVRMELAAGILASSETIPMWGGVAIYENIGGVSGGPDSSLGSIVGRATSESVIAGWSVFDQAYGMVMTAQSPVPLAASYMSVHYYRLGSNARIAVACDPNLASLINGATNASVSWDYTNQQLVPYVSTTISSGTYTTGTGTGAVALTTGTAHGLLPGDTFVLSAVTGTGSYANLDGIQTATAGTTGTTLNFTAATGLTLTITGGTVSNGTALPVKVLDVQVGNSMTVSYSSSTGGSWNYTGTTAIILI